MEEIEKLIKPYFAEGQTEVDITSVLKYIEEKGIDIRFSMFKDIRVCAIDYRDGEIMLDYGNLPIKPLRLYTETEKQDLLDLLLKVK